TRWPRRRGEGAACGWARRRCSSATRRRAAAFPRRGLTPGGATRACSASSLRRRASSTASRASVSTQRCSSPGPCAWATRSRCCEQRASARTPADPDLVLAALLRPAVEPAVELLGHEARVLDQGVPLGRRQPVEREARALLGSPDGERERAGALVPVGALEDARLALEPDAV